MSDSKPKFRKFADWCRRIWLNERHGRAYIIASVDVDDYGSTPRCHITAYFDIADCSQNACLDFCVDADDSKQVEKIKRKMERFRKEWNQFEAKVLERIEQVQARKERWDAKQDT